MRSSVLFGSQIESMTFLTVTQILYSSFGVAAVGKDNVGSSITTTTKENMADSRRTNKYRPVTGSSKHTSAVTWLSWFTSVHLHRLESCVPRLELGSFRLNCLCWITSMPFGMSTLAFWTETKTFKSAIWRERERERERDVKRFVSQHLSALPCLPSNSHALHLPNGPRSTLLQTVCYLPSAKSPKLDFRSEWNHTSGQSHLSLCFTSMKWMIAHVFSFPR
jgi:hypothetical protein